MEVWFHSFLISASVRGEWRASRPGCLVPGWKVPSIAEQETGRPALFGEEKILLLLPVIEPRLHSCPPSNLGIVAASLFWLHLLQISVNLLIKFYFPTGFGICVQLFQKPEVVFNWASQQKQIENLTMICRWHKQTVNKVMWWWRSSDRIYIYIYMSVVCRQV